MDFNFAEKEKEILKFWKKNKIPEKLRKKNQGKERWSFLDGPITANNPMAVHHAWGRAYKDTFQRYKAMQGFDERFQNGFDCQGLWVEVEVEKELKLKNKKDIENLVSGEKEASIAKFVQLCKERVLKFSKIQTKQSIRLGQWMDWENSYYTMSDENNYTIWHFLKKCNEKGWIYKGHDTVAWCPRCETAISQHEILTEDYKEITHESVFFRLPIINKGWENTYFLVWTTTPWTIPANVAVGINSKYEYGIWEDKDQKSKDKYIFLLSGEEKKPPIREEKKDGGALSLEAWIMQDSGKTLKNIKIIETKELLSLKYKGPFDDLDLVKKAKGEHPETFHSIVDAGKIVNDEEGTGLLHIAPGAGQEDFKIGKKEKLSVISPIADNADYLEGMGEFTGKNAKKQPEIIIKSLQESKYLFNKKPYLHRYPACWRCKEELVWKVADEWYISMQKLREKLINVTKKIKWIPGFGLERELDWLLNMDDWLISKKNRYWGLALPIYECEKCGNFEIIGSKKELKERAVEGWKDFEGHSPHRPFVDRVKIKCSKCNNTVSRILDVGNPWLDAGIVPFSTLQYFSDKNYWQKWFPIDFICESFPGQFKNWFYSLIVMSTVLENKFPAKIIFGYATVVDEKGEEMHKSKGNAIWFDDAVDKIGADVMRWMYVKQNPAYNLRFGYNVAKETQRKILNLWNSYIFFKTYVSKEEIKNDAIEDIKPNDILDKWILSRLNGLIENITKKLDNFDTQRASLEIENFFLEDLSLWYIRRSRKRFQRPKNKKEKNSAATVLHFVLLQLMKLMAPMMPFFSEEIYLGLKKEKMPESIHLFDYPKINEKLIDKKLEEEISKARSVVNLVLSKRKESKIKVRQPLQKLVLKQKIDEGLFGLIKEEVNIKEIVFDPKIKEDIELDTKITKELKEEGDIRETIRAIQDMRKKAGLKKEDIIEINYDGDKVISKIIEKNKKNIEGETLAEKILRVKKGDYVIEKEININNKKLWIGIRN